MSNVPMSLYDVERAEYLPMEIISGPAQGRKRSRIDYALGGVAGTGALAQGYALYDLMSKASKYRRAVTRGEVSYEDPVPRPRSHSVNMSRFGTVQRDVKGIYGRKRRRTRRGRRKMRRMKKRSRRFRNKVRNVIYSDLGEWNYNKNQDLTLSTTAGNQTINCVPLCSWAGSAIGDNRDIQSLTEAMRRSNPLNQILSGAASSKYPQNIAYRMRKALIDITITNTGAPAVELDIYECYAKRDIGWDSWDKFAVNMLANMDQSTNEGGTALSAAYTLSNLGITPFNVSGHGRYVKIKNVTRIYLEPGKSTSFIRKGRYRKQIKQSEFEQDEKQALESNQFARQGLTRLYLFKVAGVPSATSIAPACTLRLNINKHYSFNILQTQTDTSAFV